MIEVKMTEEVFDFMRSLINMIPETNVYADAPAIFKAVLDGGIANINYQLDQHKVV